MMKKALLALAIISIFNFQFSISQAQSDYDLDSFEGLKSEGPTPSDLRLSLEELYSLDKQRVRDYNDGKLRNRDKVLNASYHIRRLMTSGRILYGDPITRMVERIADTLLKDYPELRNELRFYTLKSPDVNAFATGQGMVFICTGLVAQLDDEAQLAFIISHEIVHYLRKHSLEEISRRKRDSDDIEAETQEMRDFIKYHNRSREMESEADSLGLTMFYLNSPYAKDVTEGVFDVLQYGYLPFDDLPFDTAYFNTPYYRLPNDHFMKQVDPITARDDYNDSLSTHPNILKRRKATAAIIGNTSGGSRYVTMTVDEFEKIRALARFESVRQDMIYAEYVRGFYDCYMLQKLYPDNQFVERALCQSLYGLSKFKTYTNTSKNVGDYKDFEGEVQQCYYLFRRIKKEDLALITAHRLWESHIKYQDDSQISDMAEDIFHDLFEKYNWKADFFSAQPPTEVQDDTASTENLSKYERLKRKKKQQQKDDLHSYAFTDLFQMDGSFAGYLAENLKERPEKEHNSSVTKKKQLVYCPTYFVVDNKEGNINILKSERCENTLYSHISQAAAKSGIGSIDFSDQSLHNITTSERYNDWVDLNEWVSEYWQAKGAFDMHFSMQPKIMTVTDKYNAGTINMTVVLNRENITNRSGGTDLIYIWFPPLTAVSINNMIAHNEATLVYSFQVDAHQGKQLSKHYAFYNLKDETSRLKNTLYDHYMHIDEDTLYKTTGYLGSRLNFSISPNVGFGGINLFAILSSGRMTSEAHIASFEGDLMVEYLAKRSRGIELRGGYTMMDFARYDDYYDHSVYKMNQISLSLGWRVYNDPAPLGYYWEVGADMAMVKIPNPPAGMENSYTHFGGHIQAGRNHIFKDRILFGYFVRYTLYPTTLTDFVNTINYQHRSVLYHNLFRIGFNIGFVPPSNAKK